MTRNARLLLLTVLLAPLGAFAQAAPVAPAAPLVEWDKLSPAQREMLVAPLKDRWNANPEERARMLERARRWQAMPPAQRDRALHGMSRWEHMPPKQRDEARALFHFMRGQPEAERKAFLAQWRQMTPEQKSDWLKMHPAPERQPRRD
jgi:hypothetical protein